MSTMLIIYLTLGCVLTSAAATGLALIWLRRHQVMDEPNHRSSHDRPTPRGGGLAVVPIVALCWIALAALGAAPLGTLVAVAVAVGFAALSWRDDRSGGLPVWMRLGAQILGILIALFFLPGAGHVFQGLLPEAADFAVTALLWVWFVNLFNFMDGIDGITGSETVMIGLGVTLVAVLAAENDSGAIPLGASIAAAALGFLVWNWQPAKLFLGDVGSIPLGFLLGWLLLGLAGSGHWAPALILPLYYLADATLTLLYRMVRGRRFWEGHREHFYQRAVQKGLSHAGVVLRIVAGNIGLVLLALLGVIWPWISLALALGLVVGLLVLLLRQPQTVAPLA
ncbi:MAG TPA: glycosyltransferase family 4 protein [Aliidongia sp.]|nr:glycosyltransferase family 4 protein [Aliidongia sp.]